LLRPFFWILLASGTFCLAQAPVPPPPAKIAKAIYELPPQDYTIELTPDKAKASQNPLRMTYHGWQYMPEGLALFSEKAAAFPEEERRLLAAISAAKKDGIQAILPYWSPTDRPNISQTIAEPKVREGMTGFLRSIENSIVLAKVLYGQYSILLVHHVGLSNASQAPARYVMKKMGEQYFLTDELAADPAFIYMAEKYCRQLSAQISGQVAP
jgi:hypothetical protein